MKRINKLPDSQPSKGALLGVLREDLESALVSAIALAHGFGFRQESPKKMRKIPQELGYSVLLVCCCSGRMPINVIVLFLRRTKQKEEWAVSCLSSLNARRRSEDRAASLVSEAALENE
jgi:hypothetical protein